MRLGAFGDKEDEERERERNLDGAGAGQQQLAGRLLSREEVQDGQELEDLRVVGLQVAGQLGVAAAAAAGSLGGTARARQDVERAFKEREATSRGEGRGRPFVGARVQQKNGILQPLLSQYLCPCFHGGAGVLEDVVHVRIAGAVLAA